MKFGRPERRILQDAAIVLISLFLLSAAACSSLHGDEKESTPLAESLPAVSTLTTEATVTEEHTDPETTGPEETLPVTDPATEALTETPTEALTEPPRESETEAPQTTETDPPATEPETAAPVTKPPETKPPETKPPETKPPETKPPETKPPVTKQPETKPPETEKPEETTPVEPTITLYAADFGAVGDGVTDDGPAIDRAVEAAVRQKANLTFEKDKTYYVGTTSRSSSPFRSPFSFTDVSGIVIDGQGSTFRMAPGINYFAMTRASDMTIRNCHFDLSAPVYLVGTVTAVNGKVVTFQTDLEPYADRYDYSSLVAFSIKYNAGLQARPHRFLSYMEKIGSRLVNVTYTGKPGCAVGDVVFLPNPGIGHCYGELIYIGGCTGTLTFENIDIYAATNFVAAIKGNDAEMYFEDFDLVASPANRERAIRMVAWRDGFHCKDNRKPLHWNECDAEVLFDDVFNVSGTLGAVTYVNGNNIRALNYEYQMANRTVSFDCRQGDILDFYDLTTGSYYGSAVVTAARNTTPTTITLDRTVDLPVGCVIGNRSCCAPGSTITNSRFEGTFRFLRDISIRNTDFRLLAMWIMVEGSVEGPIPSNVTFRRCTFEGGTIQIDAYNRNTKAYLPEIGKQIQNIRALGCTFTNTKITSGTGCTLITN